MKTDKILTDKIVTILLATYNGEKFLSRQLDSILNQTFTNWHLIIRDDNSNDNTIAIIEQYRKTYPKKIEVIKNTTQNKGSLSNFNTLLQAVPYAEYIMFCDQDDEWKKDKIENSFSKIYELEMQYGIDCPTMIFTNFQYVDENLKIIQSKKNFKINRIENFGFAQLLAQNPVYGCTTIINKALSNKVGSIPVQAENHDYWVALIAAAFGKLYYLDIKTVFYRQHANNISGNFDNDTFNKRFHRIFFKRKNYKDAVARRAMMSVFKERYNSELSNNIRTILDSFLVFFSNKSVSNFFNNINNKVRCQTLAQTILFYTTIIFSNFNKK